MAVFTAIGVGLGATAGAGAFGLGLATTAAVVGGGLAIKGTLDARDAQREQTKIANQQARAERRRSVRQNIRQAQIARARSVATAQGAGSLTSSGGMGGIGAIGSQLGEAIGFSGQMGQLQTLFNRERVNAANAQALAGFGGSLLNFGIGQGALDFLKPQGAQPTSLDSQERF